MQKFLKSTEYRNMKVKYEKEYFKLFGKYAWYDGDKITNRTKQDTQEYFKNKLVTIKIVDEDEDGETTTKTKSKSFYSIWSSDPDMREYNEVIFNANLAKVKNYQFNLFQGFDHLNEFKPKKKLNLDVIYEHFRCLVNYIEKDFEYFLNFLAHVVQKPWLLPDIAMIFISDEGTGKDITGKFISNVFGQRYCGITEKLELVCGKFNSTLAGKLFFILNETNPVESRERQENIKSMITARDLYIEGKHKDPVKCENFCRFMFFSNRLFAFPTEQKARRPKIHQSSNKYTPEVIGADKSKKYFDKLLSVFESQEYQYEFLQMLKNRDISKWNPKDFEKTDLHKTLEENSLSPIVSYLATVVSANIDEEIIEKTTSSALKEFSDHLKTLNYKFDYTQEKFNTELQTNYQITKKKSSVMKFVINIPQIRKLLETKYKYDFSELDNDNKKKEELPLVDQIKNVETEIHALQAKLELLKEKQLEENNKNKVVDNVTDKKQQRQNDKNTISNLKKINDKTNYDTFDDIRDSVIKKKKNKKE